MEQPQVRSTGWIVLRCYQTRRLPLLLRLVGRRSRSTLLPVYSAAAAAVAAAAEVWPATVGPPLACTHSGGV